jgi:hypothetical protein
MRARASKLFLATSIMAFGALGSAGMALAAYEPQDYSKAEAGVVAELKAALESFWVPLVIIIAVPLGIKLFRRLVH